MITRFAGQRLCDRRYSQCPGSAGWENPEGRSLVTRSANSLLKDGLKERNMSKYLITGVAGFIAARVAEMLLDEGHFVVGIDNLNNAYDVRMKEHRLGKLQRRPGFQFEQMDISERLGMETLFNQEYRRASENHFAAVINLAARAGVRQSVENPWIYVDTNVTGTLNLLEMSRQFGVPKFILASTSRVYGADAPLPTPDKSVSDQPSSLMQPAKGAEVMCHAYHYYMVLT
jgi:nucleoside-diphosphate-sugar epimerase